MKKFLPILLAGFVAITVVACGGEEEAAEGDEDNLESPYDPYLDSVPLKTFPLRSREELLSTPLCACKGY